MSEKQEQKGNKFQVQDVFITFILVFALELLLYVSVHFFGIKEFVELNEANVFLKGALLLGLYLLQVAAMLLPLWLIVVRKYKSNLEDFSFKWIGTKDTLSWVVGGYVFYIGLQILIITLFYGFGIDAFGFQPQQSIFEVFGRDLFSVIIAFVVAIIIAPLAEEIFFRGFILKTLMNKIGVAWAIALTTLIFAAVHFEFQSIMPLIMLSLILNVIFVKTKSIWPSIIFHMMNNTISFFAIYYLENTGIFL